MKSNIPVYEIKEGYCDESNIGKYHSIDYININILYKQCITQGYPAIN